MSIRLLRSLTLISSSDAVETNSSRFRRIGSSEGPVDDDLSPEDRLSFISGQKIEVVNDLLAQIVPAILQHFLDLFA